MSFTRRFAAVQLAPPLLLALPAALLFLRHVMSISGDGMLRIAGIAAAAYVAGAAMFALLIAPSTRVVEQAVAGKRDPSESVSRCLDRTELAAAILWIGWGLILAMAGSGLLLPTFLGIQYFAEAALIVAAPAMAWSYWTGKQMLTSHAGALLAGYAGRPWSVGVKIAMVFIGFFAVSVGAIVLVVSSRVAQSLGEAEAYRIGSFSLMVAMMTATIFAVATWFLARDITSPMRVLVTLAQEMADGRFDTEHRIFSDDQVGELARSFATTRETLRMLIGRVRSSGGVITEGVVTMTAGTSSLIGGALEQTGLAEESTLALRRVTDEARSVLEDVERVAELTGDSASRASELRASSHEVGRRAVELFSSAEQSSTAANEIDAAAREMARRSMELSGVGSEVLAFVSQMEATIAQITRTGATTADLSVEVRQNAGAGEAAVEATVAAIRKTQESMRRITTVFDSLQQGLGQIDRILEFIGEVTRKTHLLSLNAAIIAAHAGDADSGFSVIADEVRELAERTGSSTKEISGIIRNVRPLTREALTALEEGVASVDETVALAQKASGGLATIRTSTDRSLEMTHSVSASLEDQAEASRHLHRVIGQMSDNVAEMHRATEGQAEATRMLAAEAERVHDVARQVKRATEEQTEVEDGIARAMEAIAADVRMIRDRLGNQIQHTQQIAANSDVTLTIAHRNNGVAEQFGVALGELLRHGQQFAVDVARFRA